MNLVEFDLEWPVDWVMKPNSIMREPVERPLQEIVANGINNWMHKTGTKPTDVIFGRKAITKLREEMSMMSMVAMERQRPDEPPTNEYMGLVFHRDFDAQGVTLLTRGPAHMI